MICLHPVPAWQDMRSKRFVFTQDARFELGPRMDMPCGGCTPCRMNQASENALRCQHEAQLHECNQFLTLTVDDEHFPHSEAEWLESFNRGLDRIRKAVVADCKARGVAPVRFRTFGCRELGEHTRRPHGHLLAFGVQFPLDRVVGKGRREHVIYESDLLTKAWGLGFCQIGEFSAQSANYVARYALKKHKGSRGELGLVEVVHPLTGEVISLPESISWARSRRPGIGAGWFAQFGVQQVEQGAVILRGGERRPVPAYYSKLAKRIDPLLGAEARAAAELHAVADQGNRTPERREVRGEVFAAKTKNLHHRSGV